MPKLAVAVLVLLVLTPCGSYASSDGAGELDDVHLPTRPIPEAANPDPARVQLGARLYRFRGLSGDGTRSCADCHPVDLSKRNPTEAGMGRETRDPPTLLNVVHSHFFNWDGEHINLGDAIRDALVSRAQMSSSPDRVAVSIQANPALAAGFEELYGRELVIENVIDALTGFVATLVTPDAPFDRYLAGDTSALEPSARAGLGLFIEYGCITCHNGMLLGGNLLQQSHGIDDYFSEHPTANASDLGRFEVTGDEHDRYVFRVAPLRNVELTPPYFNDGSADTLELAIEEMGEHQIGADLDEAEKTAIADFLRALTAPPRDFGL